MNKAVLFAAGAKVSVSEQALIDDCLAGRHESFAALIAPYQDRLYNTLYRLTGDRDDAAELFQEAMIRAYKGLRTYQGDAAFYTWLYRIAFNVALTQRRRSRIRATSTDDRADGQKIDIADREERTQPSRHMENDERRVLIEKALASLPENYRMVLVLKDIDGLRYEEIGEILDIPVGTVRSRLHRARGEMRDRLKPLLDRGEL